MALQEKQIAGIIVLRELHKLKMASEKKKVQRKFWVKPFLMKRSEHDLEAHLLKDLLWKEDDFRNFTRLNAADFEDILNLVPKTEEEWLEIAMQFHKLWQFPHTLGALDGKHIRIKAPANTGSQFYNFKGFYSIVLFASVDAHGKFNFIDVGCNGKASDSAIYQEGYLFKGLKEGTLNIPGARGLPLKDNTKIPYFFIGDDAFGLDRNLMKPYNRSIKLTVPQQVFNYRICRARMVVECAFGRLSKRFSIFQRPIEVLPSTVDLIVLSCCTLHNYLTKIRRAPIAQDFCVNTSQPTTFSNIGPQSYNTYRFASRIRDEIASYCISEGNVDFQWQKLNIKNVN